MTNVDLHSSTGLADAEAVAFAVSPFVISEIAARVLTKIRDGRIAYLRVERAFCWGVSVARSRGWWIPHVVSTSAAMLLGDLELRWAMSEPLSIVDLLLGAGRRLVPGRAGGTTIA